MKALVFGCNGLLGQNVVRFAPEGVLLVGSGTRERPVSPELGEYHRDDISDAEAVRSRIRSEAPDWIINCAAMTHVDRCETEPVACDRINRDAPAAMASSGIPMVQISTDYVFDGKSGPYRESDPTGPLGKYGRSKLESEGLVLGASPDSLILRTMLLMGSGRGEKTSFVEFVRDKLRDGQTVRAVTDQVGCPTLADELAQVIWMLVGAGKSGLYHVSGSENRSRFDWALDIARHYGLDTSLVEPALTEDLNLAAPRPLLSGFILEKLERETGFPMSGISAQLKKMA